MTQAATRVLVVDDQRLMRDGIASLLGLQDGIVVVGVASNGQEAVEAATRSLPDVVLMDIRMPVMDGIAATRAVLQTLPECRVLMLTTFDDEAYILGALQAGAVGYLLKDLPANELAQAIRAAHQRVYQLDSAVAQRLVAALGATPTKSTPLLPPPTNEHQLSEREREVVQQIARGATNREIAQALVISEGTVKNHISNILGRLGLRDRTQLALYAYNHAFVPPNNGEVQ